MGKNYFVPGQRYVQIAFNHSLYEVSRILPQIPYDPRIMIEAGTPFIKREGINGINYIRRRWQGLLVADLKITDGAVEEVMFAANAGANAITVMGNAPIETLNDFTRTCKAYNVISMIDMLGEANPLHKLLPLREKPNVVVIHKGRDEEKNARNIIRYKDIGKVRSKYDVKISVAGGLTINSVRPAYFNGADIAIINIVEGTNHREGIPMNSNFREVIPTLLDEAGY